MKQQMKCSDSQQLIWLWSRKDAFQLLISGQNFSWKTLKLIDIFLLTGAHYLASSPITLKPTYAEIIFC